jgi:hypothetical protein
MQAANIPDAILDAGGFQPYPAGLPPRLRPSWCCHRSLLPASWQRGLPALLQDARPAKRKRSCFRLLIFCPYTAAKQRRTSTIFGDAQARWKPCSEVVTFTSISLTIVAASLVTNCFPRWLITILFIPLGPIEVRVISDSFLQASMFLSTASSTPEKCLAPSFNKSVIDTPPDDLRNWVMF